MSVIGQSSAHVLCNTNVYLKHRYNVAVSSMIITMKLYGQIPEIFE